MDYSLIAKYNKNFKIPEESDSFFVEFQNYVGEFKCVPTKLIYDFGKKSIVAYKHQNMDFVLYDKKLEIYVDGQLSKTFKGKITDLNGIFYIQTKEISFVVNENGETAFASPSDRLIYFTENGTIFYTVENDVHKMKDNYKCNLSLKNNNLITKNKGEQNEATPNISDFERSNDKKDKSVDLCNLSLKNTNCNNLITKNKGEQNEATPNISDSERSNDKKDKSVDLCNLSLKNTNGNNLIKNFPDEFYRGFLVSNKLGKICVFNQNPDPIILIDQNIKVYAFPTKIYDILCITHIKIENTTFLAVLTKTALFLIYENLTVKYETSGFIGINARKFCIHNFEKEFCFAELFSYFLLFDHKIFLKNSAIFSKNKILSNCNSLFSDVFFNPENALCKIMFENQKNRLNSNFDTQKLIFNFLNKIPPLVLCKAYRLMDEKGKMELLNFINFNKLGAEELFLVLHYHPEHYKRFVNMCIKENKLFLIKDYYVSLNKTNRGEEFKKYLLEKEILIENEKVPNLSRIQGEEIESQRIFYSKL
ncbi:hypothetical protein NUSPORA_02054 [Nucleospora cyclopteri]